MSAGPRGAESADHPTGSRSPKDDGRSPPSVSTAEERSSPVLRRSKPFRRVAQTRGRVFKAYRVTILVLGSYLLHRLVARFVGAARSEQRLLALHRRNARLIERAMVDLQGLYIKVGQALSIMANFLPAEFRDELEGMQDQVPPRPFSEIEARIRSELGHPPHQLFARFERVPIASASLGQVHEAFLHDGTHCAVKVQHCDIEEIARLDLNTIRTIMNLVQWFLPIHGIDNYYREIKSLILEELDFSREANNIRRIRKNFEQDPRVSTPVVIERLSTSRVLTLSFVEGTKVSALDELDRIGVDRKELARQIVHAFCQMIFVDGVYHADPHPGNLLVQRLPSGSPCLVLIDFGAVAELSQPMREGIPEFLEGVLRRDTERLIRAMQRMGFLAVSSDRAIVERVIDHFHRKFQDEVRIESLNLKDIKVDPQKGLESLLDLRKMNVGLRELSSSIHVPRDWVLLERTLLLLTGVCTQLDPEMNPTVLVRPYVERFVLGNRDWTQIALEAVKDTALRALALPETLDQYLRRAVRGELEVRVRDVREGFDGLYALGRQALYVMLFLGLASLSVLLDLSGRRKALVAPLAVAAGVALVCFLVSSIVNARRRS